MVIHQLVPNFVPGDATGQAAVHLRLLLRRLGLAGELYSGEVHPSLTQLVHPLGALRPRPSDLVLYHHGIASPLSGRLLHLGCRKGVVFHNISPESFYRGTSLHEALIGGRAQLAAMAPFVDLAIGVSDFNAAELREAGFGNVHTVPLFIEPERFTDACAEPKMRARLEALSPMVLSVSRVVAHKRFEDLLSLHRELRRIRPEAQLVIAGGYQRGDAYFRRLASAAREMGGVTFLGRVSNAELVAAYRSASLFVSMSEHEGFGVPFLEAFATGVPVLAFAAAAVPETLGGHGVAFTEKRFAALAELAVELIDSKPLRQRILRGQRKRLEELSAKNAARALKEALGSLPQAKAPSRRRRARPRVGIVVQRYGPELTGGAEAHARQIAQRLSVHWDITVLTSCAKDHLTWANEFPEGLEKDGKVTVHRFASQAERRIRPFNRMSRAMFGRPLDRLAEETWIAAQGPTLPGLFEHLSEAQGQYDGFLFFTYLYAPTVWGLPLVADRALLVPTAHDEPPFWMGAYADALELPRALLCNTPEEWALIQRRTSHPARGRVVGVGIEAPQTRPERFRKKYGLDGPYLMYVGRVEEGKGVGELLKFHARLRKRYHDAPQLVLAGASSMNVRGEGVRYLGRIDEQEKFDGLAGALAAVVPSRFESLSLLCLESMAVGTPVLGHGGSEVVTGQLKRSRAGLTYQDAESFEEGVRRLGEARQQYGERGQRFAQGHRWSKVVDIYLSEMERIIKERR